MAKSNLNGTELFFKSKKGSLLIVSKLSKWNCAPSTLMKRPEDQNKFLQ